jgi:hypothetical protein
MASDARKLQTTVFNKDRVLLNTFTGASILLEEARKNPIHDARTITLEQDSVVLQQKKWGIFDLGLVEAFKHNFKLKRAFLFGTPYLEQPALYLTESDQALKITGKTRLKGILHLPKRGIDRAYIEDKNFEGNQLYEGTKLSSEKKLPPLAEEFENLTITDWLNVQDYTHLQEIYSDTIFSFHEPLSYFSTAGPLYINEISLKGHLVLHATDSIIIGANSYLENVILISPRIRVESGFEGSFQAFVSEEMIVEKNVHLNYPTVILMNDKDDAFHRDKRPLIELKSESSLLGGILVTSTSPDFRKPPLLKLASTAEFVGFAYITGQTELRGSIVGSLFTKTFYLKTKTATYTNHLVDAKIDGTAVPDFFLFPNWLANQEEHTYKLLKWLN